MSQRPFAVLIRHASVMRAGDQAPPPYPIVDVHVPISMVGAFDKKWEADDNQQRVQQLESIEHRLAASDEMLWASVAPLVAKIEQVTAMAEAAVCSSLALFVCSCVCAFGFQMGAISGNSALKKGL